MNYYIYVLYSELSSKYYTGQTANIEKRLKRHNQGSVPSTRYGKPWKLVLQLEVTDRSEAVILEKKIKKRGAKRFIDDHLGVYHGNSVAGLHRCHRASFETRRSSRLKRDHPLL